jgi:hypothetical protein
VVSPSLDDQHTETTLQASLFRCAFSSSEKKPCGGVAWLCQGREKHRRAHHLARVFYGPVEEAKHGAEKRGQQPKAVEWVRYACAGRRRYVSALQFNDVLGTLIARVQEIQARRWRG